MEQKAIEMLQEALEDVKDSNIDWLDDCSVTSQCLSTTFAWTSSSSSSLHGLQRTHFPAPMTR